MAWHGMALHGIASLRLAVHLIYSSIDIISNLYGILKIKNSFQKKKFDEKNKPEKINNILLITLAFTFLNPHVYLDTIVLIGTISMNFDNKFSYILKS